VWHRGSVSSPSLLPVEEVSGAFQLVQLPSGDSRGWFRDSLRVPSLPANLRNSYVPEQVSTSYSTFNVLRGVHYSVTESAHAFFQTVTCADGEVEDVLVDLRLGSPTFGGVFRTRLSPSSGRTLLMPPGVGHAFRVLSPACVLIYTMSRAYPSAQTRVIRPDGLEVVLWELEPGVIVSDRDRSSPSLQEAGERGMLPQWDPTSV
jgi:dTDP-4-dehydrorhamnose 3,5-epimerase